MAESTINSEFKTKLEALAAGGFVPGAMKFQRNMVDNKSATASKPRGKDESGGIIMVQTDNAVVDLPKSSDFPGMQLTVLYTGADGGAKISINPVAGDKIFGSVAGVTGAGAMTMVSASGVAGKDWIMTKSTINKGDYVDLVADGVDGWFIIGGAGEMVSEA